MVTTFSNTPAKPAMRIGLTGGIGSGKSTIANMFRELGIDIIDADVIAHELTADDHPNTLKIIEHFGSIVSTNKPGQLNRKNTRHLISSDPTANSWLNNLLHPQIRQAMEDKAKQSKTPYCILAIPLLTESKYDFQLDRVCVIDCPVGIQQQRAQERDQTSEQAIADIVKLQATREDRLAIANDIIINDTDLDHLKKQVTKLHHYYLDLI